MNPKKSAVDRPWNRKFLGFSVTAHRECRVRVAPQAVERFKDTMREKFREGRGRHLRAFLESLKPKLRGWANYFSVAETRNVFEDLDQWLRRKLRCMEWRKWKKPRTRMRKLIALGLDRGDDNHPLMTALNNLTHDLRLFIELSLQESDASWEEWLRLVLTKGKVRCWEMKNCSKKECPAYLNTQIRCWLVAGTMCGEKPQGEFAVKYKSCTECDVYQEAVFTEPVTEAYEHIITLIHNLKSTQDRLKALAIRDPLTGIYNRNFFNEIIANEVSRSKRYGEKFSIVIVDVDHFKKLNKFKRLGILFFFF